MNRADDAERLAPIAPPCFTARDQWIEYVRAAAVAQQKLHMPGPLILQAGQPVRFNRHFAFCADCTVKHAVDMVREGRCEPEYLLQRFPPVEGAEPVRPRKHKAATA